MEAKKTAEESYLNILEESSIKPPATSVQPQAQAAKKKRELKLNNKTVSKRAKLDYFEPETDLFSFIKEQYQEGELEGKNLFEALVEIFEKLLLKKFKEKNETDFIEILERFRKAKKRLESLFAYFKIDFDNKLKEELIAFDAAQI